MGYHSDRAIDTPQHTTRPVELPGNATYNITHMARMLFIPEGKLASDGVWRYFTSQAQALRVKRTWTSHTHRATTVQYWNVQAQDWRGE
jgi:hypothetical protein